MEKKQHQTDGNSFDNAEKKLDQKMDEIMKKGHLEKMTNHKIVKDVLNSKIINDLDAKLKPSLKTIFTVIGRIGIVGGALQILGFLGILGFMIKYGSIGFILVSLVGLCFAILAVIMGFGMIKFKKWIVLLTVAMFLLSAGLFILTIIFYGSKIGSNLISLIINALVTILVLKNKDMFKN